MIDKKKQANLIEKFANGNCTEEEAIMVVGWFKEPGQHLKLYQGAKAIWHIESNADEAKQEKVDLDSSLDRVHHQMSLYSEIEEANQGRGRRFIRVLSRIAAVLFLPLLVTTSLYINERFVTTGSTEQFTEISVTHGSKLNTQLPDGTQVWLNSGSTLRYPQTFSRHKRQVELSGEAYFDVAHDPSHPFIVHTGAIDLRVLGTRFNVMAYPEEDGVFTTLEHGKVSIERVLEGKKSVKLCCLEPGEHAIYQKKDGNIKKIKTRTDKYTSWKEGKLIFRNDPLEKVIKRLERWYNTEIEIAGDHKLPETPYTLTIEDEAITQVLEYLSVASAISWRVIPSEKKENGEFTKTKYVISN